MKPDSGHAFVVIQHLQADGPTLTRDILARITSMEVITARDRLAVLPNHVYTIPPGTQLTIAGWDTWCFAPNRNRVPGTIPLIAS
jgi:two-component system CheB/CheR fusion protein